MTANAALIRRLKDAVAAVHAKDFESARVLLKPVAEACPNDARPWFWLAVASPSAESAIPCLRRVLDIDATHAQARQALAKLLLTQGAALMSAGRRDQALATVSEATSLTPESDRVWVALAVVSSDPAVRLDALRRAHTINPLPATRTHFLQALLLRARALATNDRDAARASYHELLALDPRDLRAWHGLTDLATTTSDALETARGLVAAAPDHEAGPTFLKNALMADARVLDVEGRCAEACVRWHEALAIDEFDIDAWLGLAQSTADEDEAQRAITRAFDIAPTDARVSSAMARMHEATLDAADLELPQDAFAHLEAGDDLFAAIGGPVEPALDLQADPFARFAPVEPAVTAPPTPAAIEAPQPASPEVAPAADAASVAAEERPAQDAPRKTVMIVDDSPTIRKILGLTLERAGYKVVAEPDGESALERLVQVVPDVILLDIAMPKIDGYEVCRRIKGDRRTSHVPVVMLSGKDAFFDKVKGRVAGASEYLTKPFETPQVLAAVADACQSVCK
jgi:twitching motility two-component system response regulator PilG